MTHTSEAVEHRIVVSLTFILYFVGLNLYDGLTDYPFPWCLYFSVLSLVPPLIVFVRVFRSDTIYTRGDTALGFVLVHFVTQCVFWFAVGHLPRVLSPGFVWSDALMTTLKASAIRAVLFSVLLRVIHEQSVRTLGMGRKR